jgi:UDP-glucose 4-epimerase
MGRYLNATRGLPIAKINTQYYSTWLDNTKAKFLLGWRPEYDLKKLIESAFSYVRASNDPRKVWYPG